MKFRSFDHGLDLMAPTEGYVRTPGLHISDIYNDFYRRVDPKRYDKKDKKTGFPLPLPEERVGFGSRFEEALEPQLRGKWAGYRPGEFAVQHARDCVHAHARCKLAPSHAGSCSSNDDQRFTSSVVCDKRFKVKVKVGDPVCPCGAGIIYSPDYFFYVPGLIMGEFKLTWYSSRNWPDGPQFDKWKTQIKFYLRNIKANTVWVFPFWVNGGVTHRYHECQPEFKKAYELEFSDRETEAAHQMLMRHGRKYHFIPEAA